MDSFTCSPKRVKTSSQWDLRLNWWSFTATGPKKSDRPVSSEASARTRHRLERWGLCEKGGFGLMVWGDDWV